MRTQLPLVLGILVQSFPLLHHQHHRCAIPHLKFFNQHILKQISRLLTHSFSTFHHHTLYWTFFFSQNNCFLCPLMNLSLETPTSQMTSFLLFLGLCPTSLPWERKKGNSSSPTKAGGDGGRHLHPTLQGQKTASLALWLPLLLSKGPVG